MARKPLAASAARAATAVIAELPPAPAAPEASTEPAAAPPVEPPAAARPAPKRARPSAKKSGAAAAPAAPAKAAKAAKPVKPAPVAPPAPAAKGAGKLHRPHPKLVRDSFTMPEVDFAYIARLKTAALGVGRAAKKSELLRAGLRMLATLDARTLVQVLDDLTPVKTGRPKKGR